MDTVTLAANLSLPWVLVLLVPSSTVLIVIHGIHHVYLTFLEATYMISYNFSLTWNLRLPLIRDTFR